MSLTEPLVLPATTPLPQKFNRAVLLKLAAAAGITTGAALLGDGLFTLAPWLDYNTQVQATWKPFRRATGVPAQMREVVRYATLAPSGHNTQPWKFAVRENAIDILPDYNRRLPAVDPQDRELWISLGCALENMTLAANASGYQANATYPTRNADHITVHLSRSPVPPADPLFAAIPHRQNNRSSYDGRTVSASERRRIEAVKSKAGVSTLVFTDTRHKEAIIDYIKAGDKAQFGDPLFVSELVSWIRFNKPEVLHSLDGLYTRCTGNPDVPRWLGKRFLSGASAPQQADTSARKARSSSGLIVITSERDDKAHWIETGRLYERLALTPTASGLSVAFLNQPAEVPVLRSQIQRYLGIGTDRPQLMLRFGYASDALPHSPRRPLESVLV